MELNEIFGIASLFIGVIIGILWAIQYRYLSLEASLVEMILALIFIGSGIYLFQKK